MLCIHSDCFTYFDICLECLLTLFWVSFDHPLSIIWASVTHQVSRDFNGILALSCKHNLTCQVVSWSTFNTFKEYKFRNDIRRASDACLNMTWRHPPRNTKWKKRPKCFEFCLAGNWHALGVLYYIFVAFHSSPPSFDRMLLPVLDAPQNEIVY